MNIASLVVHVRPEHIGVVQPTLESFAGVEVHTTTKEGRMVVTVEETPGVSFTETVTDLHNTKGVLSAAMVYHFCDSELSVEDSCDDTQSA
jgi:nitrate reductase NapD